jgi:hypothetical protein
MHPPVNFIEQMGRSELWVKGVAEPGPQGECEISAAEECEACPPVPLTVSEDDRAHHGRADGG